ncbi:MAG: 50S ribosomal protein L17 [Firmicutes bacterium]|jgi:large subunit ribosomal protein L17|nr:50S ribosomal protein L17 [Bacillota bacterium]
MSYSKLGRTTAERRALLRSLVTALLAKEKIITTEAKAYEVKRLADKMITLSKKGTLHARRQTAAFLLDEDVVKKLFDTVSARYAHRAGGYTRILKIGPRKGDSAPMAMIELV